jgi:tRNA-modifying protein YgfZ
VDVSTATDSLAAEHQALTERCGLVDRSERGKLALTGAEAKEFLHGQVTNDVEALQPGQGCYAAFLTHKGKMLGDLRVLHFGDELFLDTERVALQELFNMIRRYKLGRDVELHKRTVERGLLSLVGPGAREAAGPSTVGPREHDNAPAEVGGVPVRLVTTSEGIDVICDAARTAEVKAALAGVPEVSEAAAEIVRVEAGRPRYGVDLDDSVIPQEAGLNERAVSFTKGCYVGQETVARLFYRGKPNRHLRGLRLSEPAATGDALRLGDRQVGRLGSAVVSPALGPIGLAIVRREAGPGDTLAVGNGDGATATVVELPFPAGA